MAAVPRFSKSPGTQCAAQESNLVSSACRADVFPFDQPRVAVEGSRTLAADLMRVAYVLRSQRSEPPRGVEPPTSPFVAEHSSR